MPHPLARRACRGVPGVRGEARELQQLPRPALPQVPERRQGRMGGDAQGGGASGRELLPRGVHRPRLSSSAGHAEPGAFLLRDVQGRVGHAAQVLRGAGAAGRDDGYPAHVGE